MHGSMHAIRGNGSRSGDRGHDCLMRRGSRSRVLPSAPGLPHQWSEQTLLREDAGREAAGIGDDGEAAALLAEALEGAEGGFASMDAFEGAHVMAHEAIRRELGGQLGGIEDADEGAVVTEDGKDGRVLLAGEDEGGVERQLGGEGHALSERLHEICGGKAAEIEDVLDELRGGRGELVLDGEGTGELLQIIPPLAFGGGADAFGLTHGGGFGR